MAATWGVIVIFLLDQNLCFLLKGSLLKTSKDAKKFGLILICFIKSTSLTAGPLPILISNDDFFIFFKKLAFTKFLVFLVSGKIEIIISLLFINLFNELLLYISNGVFIVVLFLLKPITL